MTPVTCEHCGKRLSRSIGGTLKLMVKSRMVVFDGAGRAEMVCPRCGRDTSLPVRFVVHPPGPAPAPEPA